MQLALSRADQAAPAEGAAASVRTASAAEALISGVLESFPHARVTELMQGASWRGVCVCTCLSWLPQRSTIVCVRI